MSTCFGSFSVMWMGDAYNHPGRDPGHYRCERSVGHIGPHGPVEAGRDPMTPKTKREAEDLALELDGRVSRLHRAIDDTGGTGHRVAEWQSRADKMKAEAARLRALLHTLPE